MSIYEWKSFFEDEDRPEKPRRFGVTEMRSPHYTFFTKNALQDIFESKAQFVDGLKFSGGSHSLLTKSFIKEVTEMAHKHDVYVSTGDWAEHLVRQGPSAFNEYVKECKQLGFDTVELNVGSLELSEEVLLRLVRLIKNGGLRAKPQFSLKFNKSDIPTAGDRAFGAYTVPAPRSSEIIDDVDLLIRRAERCLEAGADMIMIDGDDIRKYGDSLRSDVVAKIIGRIGLEKTMFEASNPKTSEWFIKRYGPRVNLFVDHSHVMDLECLRGRSLEDEKKVGHLLKLQDQGDVKLFRADLTDEGSFDDAVAGCDIVFHVATPVNFHSEDPEVDMIKPAIKGTIDILKACLKSNSVKRVVLTSSAAAVSINNEQGTSHVMEEGCWSDVDLLTSTKPFGWGYPVSKTLAEKAAWKFAEENKIDLITVIPCLVMGPSPAPYISSSFSLTMSLLTGNNELISTMKGMQIISGSISLTHVEDVVNAHIFLAESESASGRYICCNANTSLPELAKFLNNRYPQYNVPTDFQDVLAEPKLRFSSDKLIREGFSFKYEIEEMYDQSVEYFKSVGLLQN